MSEGAGVNEELDAEEQDEALALRALHADDGVVEADVGNNARKDLVRELDDDVGDHEGLPVVHLSRPFTDLVK